MKPYLASNRIPSFGLFMLIVGSMILGTLLGVLAYFVSNLIYYIFAFSLAVGVVTMVAYGKLLNFAKVRHSIITALMGLITGLLVAFAYYTTPYLILRMEFITNAQQNFQVSTENASIAFDNILIEDTGTGGLVGYMKLRAREGDQYTNYVVANGMPIHEFSFSLKSTWAWTYWLVETLFFSIPTAWIGYDGGKRAFSVSANDWYGPFLKQICVIPLEYKERILALLKANQLQEVCELTIAEEKIAHPMMEIYEQRAINKKGDILLTVKQTNRENKDKIKRSIISQWEVSESCYKLFVNAINDRLEE